MFRKTPKSELERYVDSAVVSLRVQAIKRPEEWVRGGSLAAVLALIVGGQVALGLLLAVAAMAVQMWLARGRVGGNDPVQGLSRLMREMAVRNARSDLRKGRYDAKVGPEARAILESSAMKVNELNENVSSLYMLRGGGMPSLLALSPFTKEAENLMIQALACLQQIMMMKRLPGEEMLSELRAIDAQIAALLSEANALAREFTSSSVLGGPLADPQARADARRELDQGA